jgi:hypothetical protein
MFCSSQASLVVFLQHIVAVELLNRDMLGVYDTFVIPIDALSILMTLEIVPIKPRKLPEPARLSGSGSV